MCVFGRVIPSLSLVISMALRLTVRFSDEIKKVAAAKKCMGQGMKGKSIVKKIRYALDILSVMASWALENSVETADSMRARGYASAKERPILPTGSAGLTYWCCYRCSSPGFIHFLAAFRERCGFRISRL